MVTGALPGWLGELDLDAEHLVVREWDADRWWQLLRDGTRTLVGGQPDVDQLVRSWHTGPGGSPAGVRYTLARAERRLLEPIPIAIPSKEIL